MTNDSNQTQVDELKYRAEKLLYDLFYKGLDAGEDTVLQYQFERELGYRHRYAERCIKAAKNELADMVTALLVKERIDELESCKDDWDKWLAFDDDDPNYKVPLKDIVFWLENRIKALNNSLGDKS